MARAMLSPSLLPRRDACRAVPAVRLAPAHSPRAPIAKRQDAPKGHGPGEKESIRKSLATCGHQAPPSPRFFLFFLYCTPHNTKAPTIAPARLEVAPGRAILALDRPFRRGIDQPAALINASILVAWCYSSEKLN